MAEAVVEQRPPSARFYCHRCNIEFEDLAQDFICPQCEGGFIEQLENDPDDSLMSRFDDDLGVLDMSMDDPFDLSHPVANDIAMLMTGGRINRGVGVGGGAEALLQQFAWALAGGGADGNGPSPLVLVGSPGDYVLGGEGLDAVVTQLLGQLESSGPAPLSRDKIAAIPSVPVTSVHVDARMQCSVCWDQFTIEEKVSQLLCTHMFHTACIEPWLKLHATCPICRRSLQPDMPHSPPATGGVGTPPAAPPPSNTVEASIPSLSALLWRTGAGAGPGAPRRRRPARPSDNATSGWLATPAATAPAAAPAPSSSGSAPTLFGNIFRAAINMSRPNTNSSQSNTSSNTSSNSSSNASSNSGSSSNSSTNMDVADPDVPTPEQRRSNTAGYMMDMDIDFD